MVAQQSSITRDLAFQTATKPGSAQYEEPLSLEPMVELEEEFCVQNWPLVETV